MVSSPPPATPEPPLPTPAPVVESLVKTRTLSQLSDQTVVSTLDRIVARDQVTTAEMLAYLAEVDRRRLHVPAGYPSLYLYCVRRLHMSEDMAYKRIRAARAARRFPVILRLVAKGRLHLSAVVLLAPYLTEATVEGLLAAAVHQTKAEVEQLLACRFPRPDLPTRVEPVGPALAACQLAPGPVGTAKPLASLLVDGPRWPR